MKRRNLLTGSGLCIMALMMWNPNAAAQTATDHAPKHWTVEQATADRALRPEGVGLLYWGEKDPDNLFYSYDNKVICFNVRTQATDTILTLAHFEKLKDQYAPGTGPLKALPNILAIHRNNLVLYYDDAYYIWTYADNTVQLYTSMPATATNFSFNRIDGYSAFTQDNNLFVIKDGVKFAVTQDENPGIVNGQVVHRNEFGITKGIFWDPAGDKIAFYRMDETMVREAPLLGMAGTEETLEPTRYPEAGTTSHKVSVGVFDLNTYKKIFLKPCFDTNPYITGVTWSPDSKDIYTVQLDRAQKHLAVFCHDAATGEMKRKLFEETNPIWVEPENPVIFRPGHPDQIIWNSERNGYNHLYLYNTQGKLLKAITPDKEAWEVSEIVGCSSDGKYVYFMGTKDSPLEQQLYRVQIDNGRIKRLTKEAGTHQIRMNPTGSCFVDIYSNYNEPRVTQVIDAEGNVLKKLLVSKDPLSGYAKPETRVFTIKAADGKTDLYARMILPPAFDSTRQYPVIVYVYGGPHVQLITNSHLAGSPLTLQHFAQEGFIVFTVDSRGSAHRGFAFESAIHRNIGTVEVADQMKGIEYLYSLPYVDRNRIGVDGWSYGGFMTMSLKLRYPQVFKVAVAGGGVMNWAWYEVMYGERYMETPQNNPAGYDYANLLNLTDSVSGKILMIHGGKDATVLPKHSLYFIDACAQSGKQIDFFMYPNAAHGVYGPARKHLDRMIFEYFKNNL